MTASLAHRLLSDDRVSTLRRSDRAVLRTLAAMARDDGRLRWTVRHKTIAEKAGYGVDAVRKSLRRLTGRDKTCPDLRLVAVESGTGHRSSRYSVALSWDQEPPELLPVDAPVEAVPERPKAAPEQRPRRSRLPRQALPEVAPHGGPWLPDEPPAEEDQGDVVELLAPPDDDDRDTWCEDARRIGKPHRGRRCCGMTARQVKEKEEAARKAAARRKQLAEFTANFGPEARANAVPTEEVADRMAAAREAMRQRRESAR